MQITIINNSFNNKNKIKRNSAKTAQNNLQNPNFQGFSAAAKAFMPSRSPSKFVAFNLSSYLNVPTEQIERYATRDKTGLNNFFYNLARKLSNECLTQHKDLPFNRLEILETLYGETKQLTPTHSRLINDSRYSFNDTIKLLTLFNEKNSNFNIVRQLTKIKDPSNKKIYFNSDTIEKIANLPNSEKLSSNFENYRAYIALNHEKPDFLEKLAEELAAETPSFDSEALNRTFRIQTAKYRSKILNKIPDSTLEANFSEKGLELIESRETPSRYFMKDLANPTKEETDFIGYLLKTTNEANYQARIGFLRHTEGANNKTSSLAEQKAFLELMDNDKNYKNIFRKLKDNDVVESNPLSLLMYYADSIGSDVIAKNINTFSLIATENKNIYQANPEKFLNILKHNITNKFYCSPDERLKWVDEADRISRQTFFGETKAKLFMLRQHIVFDILPELFGTRKEVPLKLDTDFRAYSQRFIDPSRRITGVSATGEPIITPEIEAKYAPKVQNPTQAKNDTTPAKSVVIAIQTNSGTKKLPIKRETEIRRLKTQGEAVDIIRSRIKSARILDEQTRDYKLKATKMRNKYLNRIFDSIAETRRELRASGVKHPKISNEDALLTYQYINGHNRKLFLEMLNARDEFGKQKYNIVEIGKELDRVNSERNRQKILNRQK